MKHKYLEWQKYINIIISSGRRKTLKTPGKKKNSPTELTPENLLRNCEEELSLSHCVWENQGFLLSSI